MANEKAEKVLSQMTYPQGCDLNCCGQHPIVGHWTGPSSRRRFRLCQGCFQELALSNVRLASRDDIQYELTRYD